MVNKWREDSEKMEVMEVNVEKVIEQKDDIWIEDVLVRFYIHVTIRSLDSRKDFFP